MLEQRAEGLTLGAHSSHPGGTTRKGHIGWTSATRGPRGSQSPRRPEAALAGSCL